MHKRNTGKSSIGRRIAATLGITQYGMESEEDGIAPVMEALEPRVLLSANLVADMLNNRYSEPLLAQE